MIRVGLTGGIACGKSTVAETLRQHGVPVIDADRVARAVVAPGSPGLASIVAAFGTEFLTDTGELHRSRLREHIISDQNARKTLERITHPLIGQAIWGELAQHESSGANAAVVEAALMVETGSYQLYDAIIVVSTTPAQQLARVMARDQVPEQQAQQIIDAQMPLAAKEAVATEVIFNDGDLGTLKAATLEAWNKVLHA